MTFCLFKHYLNIFPSERIGSDMAVDSQLSIAVLSLTTTVKCK